MAVSKQIHQIWLQGFVNLPLKYYPNLDSIYKKNPDWKVNLWSEETIRPLIKSIGDNYLQHYDSLKLLHQKVDYARYSILFVKGGISVDVDAVALKSFDETPGIATSDFIVSKNSQDIFINNATILVSKENPLMKQLLDEIDGDCKWYPGKTACIMYSTGPMAFTKFVNNHLDKITILDPIYFEPCSGRNDNCKVDSEKTILDHRHEGTWVNPVWKQIVSIYYKTLPYRIIIFVILVLVILWRISKK